MSKQPPRVQLNFEPEQIQEQVSMQVNDYDEDVIDHLHDDELQMPDIVGKPEVKENDIFDDIPDKETGEKNPNFIYEDEPPPAKKKTVKQKKPRKPMSEEHKQKLALAREKAMAVRKAKAEEKKKMKELEQQEKDLLKAQKVKKVQKLKKEVEEEDTKIPADLINPQKLSNAFTKQDLEDAQLEAIMKYETLRKKRKEEKRRAQQVEADKQNIINQIQKPQGYRYRDGSNKWDMCY